MKKSKIIIIAGQTGTGKTSLALELARKHEGTLLSADSRQIYKEMDIGTGKIDNAEDLIQKKERWFLKGIPLYGINLIAPDGIFSAGDFSYYGKKIIDSILSEGKTLIIVGGTGFYLKSLIAPDNTVFIPQNQLLRDELEALSVDSLKQRLSQADSAKFSQMNNSDINNPRRLTRAIEVAEWKKVGNEKIEPERKEVPEMEWIGLKAEKEVLSKRIQSRIEQMLGAGLQNEVKMLAEKYSWSAPGLSTLGYREWKGYFEGTKNIDDVKNDILTAHLQYARKQMIYFRRFKDLNWRDVK